MKSPFHCILFFCFLSQFFIKWKTSRFKRNKIKRWKKILMSIICKTQCEMWIWNKNMWLFSNVYFMCTSFLCYFFSCFTSFLLAFLRLQNGAVITNRNTENHVFVHNMNFSYGVFSVCLFFSCRPDGLNCRRKALSTPNTTTFRNIVSFTSMNYSPWSPRFLHTLPSLTFLFMRKNWTFSIFQPNIYSCQHNRFVSFTWLWTPTLFMEVCPFIIYVKIYDLIFALKCSFLRFSKMC